MHSRISYFDRMEKQIRDDVLSLKNSKFGDFVDRIYPIELKIEYLSYLLEMYRFSLSIIKSCFLKLKINAI
jgi:hypothetical protein